MKLDLQDKHIDALSLLERVKVWQLFFGVGVTLLALGLTGEVRGNTLTTDMELIAIILGCVFVVASVIMRITPDPLEEHPHHYDISIAQLEFSSKFTSWEPYENVTHDFLSSDYTLSGEAKNIKISNLRVELAIYQGLLERKIENGQYYVRYINQKGAKS